MQSQVVGRVPEQVAPSDPLDPDARVAALAAAVGARDLLVLRQVAPGRFLQIGGAGRGVGWAGCIELNLDEEPALQSALEHGATVRWESALARRVLGPYHARHAALVPVDHDVAVLLGSDGSLADDRSLGETARAAVGLVSAVSPAKRLADELELLTAVRSVMQCSPSDVRQTLTHVASAAAEALGCEVAVGWLPEQDELVVVERGWSMEASADDLRAALRSLHDSVQELPLLRQDSDAEPLPSPLDPEHGVRSHYVLPLGSPSAGLLVLLHTVATPRGFTGLCQTIGEKVAEAGAVVVQSSVLRAELQSLVQESQALARRDPLTGLENRLGWDEALERCAERVTEGECASLLVVDVNGLKSVNDAYGHEAGDTFLQMGADAISSVARKGDTVARLGGDEFGLLLPGVDMKAAARVVERVREAMATAGRVGEVRLSAAVGAASCPPQSSLRIAWRNADAAMYADKGTRRASA